MHRILRRPPVSMARFPAKIVATSLVLGLFGGAAALSRCPQLVNFSPSAISVNTAAAPRVESPAPFRDAVFHPGNAHPTLVHAELQKKRPVERVAQKPQQRPKVKHRDRRPTALSSWILLTDWNGYSVPAHVSFAVVETLRPSATQPRSPPTAG